jgi:hypothetical protein
MSTTCILGSPAPIQTAGTPRLKAVATIMACGSVAASSTGEAAATMACSYKPSRR